MSKEVYRSFEGKLDVDCRDGYIILELKDFWEIRFLTVDGSDDMVRIRKEFLSDSVGLMENGMDTIQFVKFKEKIKMIIGRDMSDERGKYE